MTSGEGSAPAAADLELAQRGTSRVRLVGFAWAALTVTIFSGWFVVTRLGVTRELRIWNIAALRFSIGAILLAPAVLRRGSRLPASAWGEGLIFAVLWGVPFVLLVALGLKLTSAAQAAYVASILAIPVLGEPPSLAERISIVVIVLGVLFASRPTPVRRASTVS